MGQGLPKKAAMSVAMEGSYHQLRTFRPFWASGVETSSAYRDRIALAASLIDFTPKAMKTRPVACVMRRAYLMKKWRMNAKPVQYITIKSAIMNPVRHPAKTKIEETQFRSAPYRPRTAVSMAIAKG